MTKTPESPRSMELYLQGVSGDSGAMFEVVQKVHSPAIGPVDTKGRYLHWDKLKHMEPPEGYTPELYWHAMKASRTALQRHIPFVDKHEAQFWFCMPDPLLAQVMWISEQASGALVGEPALTDDRAKGRHLINSLIVV